MENHGSKKYGEMEKHELHVVHISFHNNYHDSYNKKIFCKSNNY